MRHIDNTDLPINNRQTKRNQNQNRTQAETDKSSLDHDHNLVESFQPLNRIAYFALNRGIQLGNIATGIGFNAGVQKRKDKCIVEFAQRFGRIETNLGVGMCEFELAQSNADQTLNAAIRFFFQSISQHGDRAQTAAIAQRFYSNAAFAGIRMKNLHLREIGLNKRADTAVAINLFEIDQRRDKGLALIV